MRFGVGIARRGWVEPRHVLNTRSLSEVLAFLARKRRRVSGL
jgi:histidinol phosphatase-like PHP family hydrolase